MPPNRPLSWHRLGPRDMPLEAKRFRHVAVAIPQLRISRGIAVSPRQQSPQPQQQDVVQNKRIRCGRATAGATRWRCVAALNNAPRPQIPRYGLSRCLKQDLRQRQAGHPVTRRLLRRVDNQLGRRRAVQGDPGVDGLVGPSGYVEQCRPTRSRASITHAKC